MGRFIAWAFIALMLLLLLLTPNERQQGYKACVSLESRLWVNCEHRAMP